MKITKARLRQIIKEEIGKTLQEQGPVYDEITGSKMWKLNGKLHREDGPAVIEGDGSKYWFLNGELHREDGPAVVLTDEPNSIKTHPGRKEWWVKGKRHREDGPAVELPVGYKEWWVNGIRHREDGPAIQPAPGSRLKKKWYLNGEYYGASSSPPQIWLAAGGRARTEGE